MRRGRDAETRRRGDTETGRGLVAEAPLPRYSGTGETARPAPLHVSVNPHTLQVLCCYVLAAILLSLSCRHADDAPPQTAAPEVVTTPGGIEMVRIPAGRFTMGSVSGKEDESPLREVEIQALWMDRYELTQASFARFDPINGSHFKAPNRPVEMVRWDDAVLYCNWRSKQEGLEPCYNEETLACNFAASGYRLPTEAEWEYACRAGTTGDYSFGSDARQLAQYAWFGDNSDKQTHAVGEKKPNPWGLYDMYGNVAEWCNDVYGKDYYKEGAASNPRGPNEGPRRVLRGGAWNSHAEDCRSARRVGETPGSQDACFARDAIGFRCVRRAGEAADSGKK
jgi:formylglycine-generating enzyme required for sulfatase activity